MRLQEVFMGKTMINKRCFIHHPNVEKQIGAMRSMYPSFRAIKKDNKLTFVGLLQVREDLPEYKLGLSIMVRWIPMYLSLDRSLLIMHLMFIEQQSGYVFIILLIIIGVQINSLQKT